MSGYDWSTLASPLANISTPTQDYIQQQQALHAQGALNALLASQGGAAGALNSLPVKTDLQNNLALNQMLATNKAGNSWNDLKTAGFDRLNFGQNQVGYQAPTTKAEWDKIVGVLNSADPMALIQPKIDQLAGILQTLDPKSGQATLVRNQLNTLNNQANYIQSRNADKPNSLESQNPKGLLPKDLIAGLKDNPQLEPLDAAVIAHKQANNQPMGFFDQGKLPSSSMEILMAKSQLRRDLDIFGNHPAIVERAKQLQDLEPIIQTAEAAAAEMAKERRQWAHQAQEKQDDQKMAIFNKYLGLRMQKSLFGDQLPPGGPQ